MTSDIASAHPTAASTDSLYSPAAIAYAHDGLTESPRTSDSFTSNEERQSLASRLNWLRAGVLGANDGILSTAGLVVGVSGAAVGPRALAAAGIAGLIAGSLSMAAGEYVSVSTQRDTERARLDATARALARDAEGEEAALAASLHSLGVSPHLSRAVASELGHGDALAAHAHFRWGIDAEALTNPWHAAFASLVSFALGALIPLIAIVASPARMAVIITVFAVTAALALTGYVSAKLGEAPALRATLRNILGGLIAMGVTYGIGLAFANFV